MPYLPANYLFLVVDEVDQSTDAYGLARADSDYDCANLIIITTEVQ